MIAARRTTLQLRPGARGRAGARAGAAAGRPRGAALRLPLGLDRLHAFVLEGMAENAAAPRPQPGALPPLPGARGRGAGAGSARGARGPRLRGGHRRLPGLLPAAHGGGGRRPRLPVRLEEVDGNGLLPLRRDRARVPHGLRLPSLPAARTFPRHLADAPAGRPAGRRAARRSRRPARRRSPGAGRRPRAELLAGDPAALARLPIDHAVAPVTPMPGGAAAGQRRLRAVPRRAAAGATPSAATTPTLDATSGLSPYLHFGHLGATRCSPRWPSREGWTPERLARPAPAASAPAGGGCARPPRRSSTSSSPGASWASTSPPRATTSTATSRCRRGRC